MRFNFPFSWYNKFGTIPSTYKEAMSYEEQILWLCKHQEDLENQFTSFQTTVSDLATLVNTFDGRITENSGDIAELSFDLHLLQNSIVQEITSSSTFSDIASAKSVYDFVTSYTPQGVVRTLDDDITLDSSLVLLGTGLYYSGNNEIKTTTGSIFQEETLMIPKNTLFYYDGTHNTFTLLYNEQTPIRDSWLKERWYWFQDTSGSLPDTSAWESKRYRADDNFNFYPSQSEIPTNYALSKVIPKLLQPSTLTTGSYFDIQGIAFQGDVINPPTASSNTAYCFFDISELTSLKFRVTGGCTNYTWFTTDIIPTDNVNQIHIETMSTQNTGYTNEIIEVTTNEDSNYVVFNFDNTDSVTPSVENFVIEVDVSTLQEKLTARKRNINR